MRGGGGGGGGLQHPELIPTPVPCHHGHWCQPRTKKRDIIHFQSKRGSKIPKINPGDEAKMSSIPILVPTFEAKFQLFFRGKETNSHSIAKVL